MPLGPNRRICCSRDSNQKRVVPGASEQTMGCARSFRSTPNCKNQHVSGWVLVSVFVAFPVFPFGGTCSGRRQGQGCGRFLGGFGRPTRAAGLRGEGVPGAEEGQPAHGRLHFETQRKPPLGWYRVPERHTLIYTEVHFAEGC